MSFKETEVGRIPTDWNIKTVDELVKEEIIDKPLDGNHGGIHPKSSDFVEEGIPFIMASDIKGREVDFSTCKFISEEQANSLKKGFAKEGDVLITHKATIGLSALVKKLETDFIILTPQVTYYRVLDYSKMDNLFLLYYFKYEGFKKLFENWAGGGSTRLYLGITNQRKLPIVLPPIEEQKAIAKILSDLDEKIEVNNKINKNLEDMAQAIFKHWFVDFEFPNEEGKPYKSSCGEMVDSELGMIPKGWEVSSLSKIANYLNGLAMQKFRPQNDEESLKVMKIKELRQGNVDNNSDLCSSNIDSKYIIESGDVIFSWSGSLLVDIWCGDKCGLNQHLFKVTSELYNKWFYYMWTKHHLSEFIKIAEGKATTMGHIKRSELDIAKVLVPNKEQLSRMNLIFDSIIDKIIKTNIESRKLSNLRDTLLPKLMSGEIRVPIE